MEATPDTLNYMIGGYIVFTVVMVIYLVSLFVRWNGLKREQEMLDELKKK